MASKCVKKWGSLRTHAGQVTEKCHFDVKEVGGVLKGRRLENPPVDVKVTCQADGMTIEIPASGTLESKYEGKFDGDNFPGVYAHNEDHITGTCTIYTNVKRGGASVTTSDDWEGEKTT